MSINKWNKNPKPSILDQMNNNYTQKQQPLLDKILDEMDKKEPIRRGCTAESCFCSGACQEIIGWKDKGKPFVFPKEEESHFEDIEDVKKCIHREHEPPTHLHIPHGKRYIHICPGCKSRSVLQPPQITF